MSICHPLLWVMWLLNAAVPPSGDLQARVIHTFREDTQGRILCFNFSPDGRRLLLRGGKTLRLLDTTSGKEVAQFFQRKEAWAEWPDSAALFPDGRTVAVSYFDHEITVVDIIRGQILRRLKHKDLGRWQALSPDGKLLVSGAAEWSSQGDRALLLWDVDTGKLLRRLRLRDPATGQELDPKRQIGPGVDYRDDFCGVAFSPDGKTVAVGVSDGSTRLCDVATGAETRRLYLKEDNGCWNTWLAFSPNGKLLAVSGRRHSVMARVWDVATGQHFREYRLPIPPAPEGFVLWDHGLPGVYIHPKTKQKISLRLSGASALAFSPDSRTLAVATRGQTFLWEVPTAQLRCRLPYPAEYLLFSPSGPLAGGGRGIGWLWDWHAAPSSRVRRLPVQELDRLWLDLGSPDAARGHQAVVTLAAAPQQAAQLLGQRLRSIRPVDAKNVDRLIAELEDKDFKARDRAEKQLRALDEAVRPALLLKLAGKPSAEFRQRAEKLLAHLEVQPDAERLRLLRGVEVLEYLGTAQARQVLEQLAIGMAGAVTTEEGRAALRRLNTVG